MLRNAELEMIRTQRRLKRGIRNGEANLCRGRGYIGLVSAVCYADGGNFVHVYDKDRTKRSALASGKLAGRDFGLVTYPEYLREGSAIHDMLHLDRIILGTLDDRSRNAMDEFIRELYGGSVVPVLHVSLASAEMIKYASNAFLGTKVAFIDEIANLCGFF